MAIKKGDKVVLHYKGTLDDGTEFDSSYHTEPLDFVVGKSGLLPKFEQSVVGKEAGDKYKLVLQVEDAYGEPQEDMVFEVPLESIPEHIKPELGMVLDLVIEEEQVEVVIIDITDKNVTFDANHPLAGEILEFEIEIVKVN